MLLTGFIYFCIIACLVATYAVVSFQYGAKTALYSVITYIVIGLVFNYVDPPDGISPNIYVVFLAIGTYVLSVILVGGYIKSKKK